MGKYEVVFLQTALDDLEEIVLYIAKDSKQNALKLNDKLLELAGTLSDFPFLGTVIQDKKLRSLDYRRIVFHNYAIFYQVVGEQVIIMRVLHGARDYPKILSGLQ